MATKPNFLIIIADDLGFSDVGCFGGEISTPHLDKVAAQGVRLTGFHTAAACSPTRAMLFSGQDNHVAGLGAMAEWKDKIGGGRLDNRTGYEWAQDERIVLTSTRGHMNFKIAALPEVLQDAGYETMLSGKWHLGMQPELAPHSRGFSRSFTMLSGCHNHYGFEPQYESSADGGGALAGFAPAVATKKGMYRLEGEEIDIPENLNGSEDDFYSSTTFTRKLIDYIETSATESKPFCAVLPFTAPHWPLQAPKRLRDKYKGRYDSGPHILREERLKRMTKLGLIKEDVEPHPMVNGTKRTEWADMTDAEREYSCRAMETYAAMVESIDECVGEVMDSLEKTGVLDSTVVIFMSDNGAEGSAWEAMPHMGDIRSVIERYYDNSLDNIGNANSFAWYGPFWAQASTAPSRLMKSFSTQGGIHVPCILRHPPLHNHASTKPGSIIDQPLTVMDIMPTFLDLAGVAHPVQPDCKEGDFRDRKVVGMKGKSWRSMLERGERCHDASEELGWELHGRAGMRIDTWKITFVPRPFGPGQWQLYDLSRDPGEIYDLKGQEPDKFKQLSEAWQRYVDGAGVVWIHDMPQIVLDTDADIIEDPRGWMRKS